MSQLPESNSWGDERAAQARQAGGEAAAEALGHLDAELIHAILDMSLAVRKVTRIGRSREIPRDKLAGLVMGGCAGAMVEESL